MSIGRGGIIIENLPANSYFLFVLFVAGYDFQLFDGIIVASALEANCDVLYSEDMQHGQIIEVSMKIINPYK
jgi:predicted nucleic acid-binding protein